MPSLIKTPSRPHRLPCRSPPPAWKLPTPWPASGRKSTRLHLPIVRIVVESRGRVLDRVDTASWKCPLQYSNLNLASLKIEAGDRMITNCQECSASTLIRIRTFLSKVVQIWSVFCSKVWIFHKNNERTLKMPHFSVGWHHKSLMKCCFKTILLT